MSCRGTAMPFTENVRGEPCPYFNFANIWLSIKIGSNDSMRS